MQYFYKSISPMNNKLFKTFDVISSEALYKQVESSYNCFQYNQGLGGSVLGKKCKKLAALSGLLYENKDFYADLITKETGKLSVQAKDEISKCIQHLDWLIENSEKVIVDEEYRLMNGLNAGIMLQPLGPLLGKSKMNINIQF